MAARTAGRMGRPWRTVQARVYAEETHCWFARPDINRCRYGGYVDQALANYRSPQARSVHHFVPPDVAPELACDRTNLTLAHLGCNSTYGRGVFSGGPQQGAPSQGRGTPPRAARGQGTRRGRGMASSTRLGVGASTMPVTVSDREW